MLRYILAVLAAAFLVACCSGAHATEQMTWKDSDTVLAKSGFSWKTAPRIQPDTRLTFEDGTTTTLAECGYATVWQCVEAKNAMPPAPTADQIKIEQLESDLKIAQQDAYYFDKEGKKHLYKDELTVRTNESKGRDKVFLGIIVFLVLAFALSILAHLGWGLRRRTPYALTADNGFHPRQTPGPIPSLVP